MPFFPEEVVEHILGSVSSHRDRNAVSLVCHAWYRIERLTRHSVFVCNCYAVRPERVCVRFPCLRSLSVKGKPHFADFKLVPTGWGATAEPWVDACARACPGLEELRLKRMVVTDDCLNHLAHSFLNLKSLVLVSCVGFSTDGLAAIATNCKFLKELDLQESRVEFRGRHWLSCFPKPSTLLESLNFACLAGAVSAHGLESLVARSPNLRRLRLNRAVPLAVLANILTRAPKLVDLGTGSFAESNNAGALISLYNAIRKCNSLRSLSGFWDSPRMIIPAIHFVCKNLTCLNLSYAPRLQSADLIEVIRPCQSVRHLWVLDHIGDVGLKVVASCCMELQELRLLPADANVLASTGVTEEGLVAISSGCRKLNSVLYFCRRMTNSALIMVAKNCPRFLSFRLSIVQPESADAVTSQPLDEGFGAIVRLCKGLRRLSLSGLLTDSVFLYIGMYAERLEMLSVASAGDSDNGMVYVLNGCKNLKELEIRNSPFGDMALLAGMHRHEAMRSLWMSSCNITLDGCRSLAVNMPGLNVEVINEAATTDEVDGDARDAKKVEKMYLYRTVAGPRSDAPGFISTL